MNLIHSFARAATLAFAVLTTTTAGATPRTTPPAGSRFLSPVRPSARQVRHRAGFARRHERLVLSRTATWAPTDERPVTGLSGHNLELFHTAQNGTLDATRHASPNALHAAAAMIVQELDLDRTTRQEAEELVRRVAAPDRSVRGTAFHALAQLARANGKPAMAIAALKLSRYARLVRVDYPNNNPPTYPPAAGRTRTE